MPKSRRGGAVKRAAPVPEQQEPPLKRGAAEPECPLLFHSPDALFASLIAPFSPEQFFTEHWEKKPLHLRHASVASYYRSLFGLADLPDLCASHALEFYRDVNAVRCVGGKKKVLNRAGRVRSDALNKLLTQNKATVQFHQPQRFKVRNLVMM
uniref:Bifunctional lysine-specific demethylase and histidyl-hydroxylase n=1 Tax=Neogobius melanostomus TaxID=47308 RepID=A0A8C6WVU9_9GOBI